MIHAEVLSRLGIAESSINTGYLHEAEQEMSMVEKTMASYKQLPSCCEEGIWFSLARLYLKLKNKQKAKLCLEKAVVEVNRKQSLITDPKNIKTYLDTKMVSDILKEANRFECHD